MKKIAITIIMISALLPMVVSCNDSHNDEPVLPIPPIHYDAIQNRADLIWRDSTSWVEYEYPADSVPFVWNIGTGKDAYVKECVKQTRYRLLAEHINSRDYLRVYRDGKSTEMLVRADSTTLWAYLPDRNVEEIIYSFKNDEDYDFGYKIDVRLFDSSDNYRSLSQEATSVSKDLTYHWLLEKERGGQISDWSENWTYHLHIDFYTGISVKTRIFVDDHLQLFQNHLGFICGDHGLICREPQSQNNPKKFAVDSIKLAGYSTIIKNPFAYHSALCDILRPQPR